MGVGEETAVELVDDPQAEPVELSRDPLPQAGGSGEAGEDGGWAQRSVEEVLSAAGPAPQARDRSAEAPMVERGNPGAFGVLFNPRGYTSSLLAEMIFLKSSKMSKLESLRRARPLLRHSTLPHPPLER